ncbi:MAG TPA: diaminopimelate decarboxylase [Candidatus Udaeobacter sp.]|nr:diaminopimelate decarboxylase [Candidatus Udaeobacter sp.]
MSPRPDNGARSEPFPRIGPNLHCEGVSLAAIAEEVGTPVYVYSRQSILDRYHELERASSSFDHLICYSVKANSNLSILALLGAAGAGADVVSGGELARARRAGIPADRIVYSGVGKSEEEIAAALGEGILLLNVESEPELAVVEQVAARMGRRAPVALRLNPDVEAGTHDYVATGHAATKFGIAPRQLKELYRRIQASAHLRAAGIDMHIGSQILTPEPFVQALSVMRETILELRRAGIQLELLDLGGGLGITYDREQPSSPAEFTAALLPLVKDLGLRLLFEPGRYLVGNAGVILTRVLYVKETADRTFVILDAGMNDLIRPALYGAFHRIEPVVAAGDRPRLIADWVGPICESGDFLARDREGRRPEPGELVCVREAGAYGMSMASNYNTRPRAPEVLVEGERYRVVRRRETLDDLMRLEAPPAVEHPASAIDELRASIADP